MGMGMLYTLPFLFGKLFVSNIFKCLMIIKVLTEMPFFFITVIYHLKGGNGSKSLALLISK